MVRGRVVTSVEVTLARAADTGRDDAGEVHAVGIHHAGGAHARLAHAARAVGVQVAGLAQRSRRLDGYAAAATAADGALRTLRRARAGAACGDRVRAHV